MVENWVGRAPGVRVGTGFICYKYGFDAGKDGWTRQEWCVLWRRLLHRSELCRRCLCPGWTAWTPHTCAGDDGKWGNFAGLPGELAEDKGPSFGHQGECATDHLSQGPTCHGSLWTLALSFTRQYKAHSDMICCTGVTRVAMQSLDNHFFKLRISIPTKLKLYNTCILPIFLYGSECWAFTKVDAWRINAVGQWYLRILFGIKWHQFVATRSWGGQPSNLTLQQ